MNQDKFNKAIEIKESIDIVDRYINLFNAENYIVYLQCQDQYGNRGKLIDLYAHSARVNCAIGKADNFCKHYREFLERCQNDLNDRRKELEREFNCL